MKQWFENKSIAVVGNALSLFNKNFGRLIDECEVVCRINLGITISSPESHGVKLDVFVFSKFGFAKGNNLFDHPNLTTDKFFHMSDRGRDNIIPNVSYYPLEMHSTLKEKLKLGKKEKPSTGLMLLDFLSTSNPKSVSIFGFDWKETPTFYDLDRIDEPHLYQVEKKYCLEEFCEKNNFKYYL